jgi:hypothetical protein
MYHFFNIEVAMEYGVDEAIMIANFQYWIIRNAANKKNLQNGKFWTYNTVDALTKIFPYWSRKQVRRILDSLIEREVLEVDCFNKTGFDRTSWYTFKDPAKWLTGPFAHLGETSNTKGATAIIEAQQIMENAFAQTGTPFAQTGNTIPDNKQNNLPNQKNIVAHATPENLPADQPGTGSSSQKKKSAAKKEKVTEHWQALVDVWFKFYLEKKGEEPTFEGQHGKQLKEIVERLKKRADKRRETKPELGPWDEKNATDTLLHFLQHAFNIEWIHNNFLLSNLVNQFDKIIADAAEKRTTQHGNGTPNNLKGQQPISAHSAFAKLSAINSGSGGG